MLFLIQDFPNRLTPGVMSTKTLISKSLLSVQVSKNITETDENNLLPSQLIKVVSGIPNFINDRVGNTFYKRLGGDLLKKSGIFAYITYKLTCYRQIIPFCRFIPSLLLIYY